MKPQKRGRKSGEKRTLTPEQEQDIIKCITEKNPDQLKLKCCLWTRDAVQQLIKQRHGITMPIRTVGDYLKRWGFTVQRPMKQAMNQKPEQVQEWLKKEYPSIHEAAKKEGAEIFWGDETAVQNKSNYARGYAPKGQNPVLKVQSKKLHINMISAISNQGKIHFMFSDQSFNSERLIEFLERLIKPGFSEKHDEHRLKPHKMDIPRHNYLFQMRDDKSSSKSLFYGISYDIIVTFSRIQDQRRWSQNLSNS